jgi:hypothetical protein
VKTCQAGAVWTGVACAAALHAIPDTAAGKVAYGAAVIGGAATTYDAASKWNKALATPPAPAHDIEMGNADEHEDLLPADEPPPAAHAAHGGAAPATPPASEHGDSPPPSPDTPTMPGGWKRL